MRDPIVLQYCTFDRMYALSGGLLGYALVSATVGVSIRAEDVTR